MHPILLHELDDGACTCCRKDCEKSRGKHPVHKNWQTAALDVDAIDRALIENWHHNIGLRTGLQPCGRALVVVDVDGPRELLAPLESEHGEFPPTLTARTGSGGLHLYYWLKDGVPIGNRAGVVPHVDFRGFGGKSSRHQACTRPAIDTRQSKFENRRCCRGLPTHSRASSKPLGSKTNGAKVISGSKRLREYAKAALAGGAPLSRVRPREHATPH